MDLRKYLDAAEFLGVGGFYWCSVSPRYHDFVPYTKRPEAEQDPTLSQNLAGIVENIQGNKSTVLAAPINGNDSSDQVMQASLGPKPSGAEQFTEMSLNILSDKVRNERSQNTDPV
jgi:hypothetical protein